MTEEVETLKASYLASCKEMDSWTEEDKTYSQQYKRARIEAEKCFYQLQELDEKVEAHPDIRPSSHPDLSDEWKTLSVEEHQRIVGAMDKCPYCGHKDGDVMLVHFHHWVCTCTHCDAAGPVRETPQRALEFYNRRVQ
jgi:hypothetical protein